MAIQTRQCRNRIERGLECHRVVPVGDRDGQRKASCVYGEVPFRPELPPAIGSGPVSWPDGSWVRWLRRYWPAPNQSGHVHVTGEASPGADAPTRLRPASLVAVASTQCRCQNQAPVAGLPMECRFAGLQDAVSTVRCRPPLGDGVNTGINGSSAAYCSLLIFRLTMPPGYDLDGLMSRLS
jgi:hypothetical protein